MRKHYIPAKKRYLHAKALPKGISRWEVANAMIMMNDSLFPVGEMCIDDGGKNILVYVGHRHQKKFRYRAYTRAQRTIAFE